MRCVIEQNKEWYTNLDYVTFYTIFLPFYTFWKLTKTGKKKKKWCGGGGVPGGVCGGGGSTSFGVFRWNFRFYVLGYPPPPPNPFFVFLEEVFLWWF